MLTDVKLLQLLNAPMPILVTELGISTDVNLLQPWNAYLSIEVTELPMLTEVKPLQPEYLHVVVYQWVAV